MLQRRQIMILAAATAIVGVSPHIAHAQATDRAAAFIKSTGDKLVAVVNGPGSAADKRQSLTQILDGSVDVDGIARFCLGRFWRQASADQQKRYVELFHQVLVTNITSKLGEYQGVKFTLGRARQQDEEQVVSTTVERPNNPPTAVDWIVAMPGGTMKIIDVVAEGTSLRLTQRQDYASYLTRNNNNIDALITAMRQQISGTQG
jgi:phospholipid transport system substrate-binding protein